MSLPSGCRSTLVHSRPVETRSTTPHSQIAVASSPQRRDESLGTAGQGPHNGD